MEAWFCAIFAGQGMLLSLAVNLSDVGAHDRLILHLLLASTSLAVVLLLGWPLLKATALAIADRRITVELLFLTGMIGALAASIQSMITGQGAIYFEVISILLVVYTFNKTMLAKRRASSLAATQGWLKNLQRHVCTTERGGQASYQPRQSNLAISSRCSQVSGSPLMVSLSRERLLSATRP